MRADLDEWLRLREGIAHRADILRAGYAVATMRRFVRDGPARVIRRAWVTLPDAAPDLVTAATAGGRISCVSVARRRGWWVPPGLDPHPHLHLVPGSGSARLPEGWLGRLHWTMPLAPQGRSLTTTVEDALAHIAVCVPHDAALVLWESAVRVEGLAPESLRRIRWTTRVARELAAELTLRGYTVLRVSYVQIVHDWPSVERRIRSAIAARLHLAS
ncbi:hypothetical protein [Microbacterium sp. bgisy207]|uniref:hypothetical protein n=1 Tax=Microbacterium sp. bgisy207 TaxID=3413800 RepID=UPI003EBF960B